MKRIALLMSVIVCGCAVVRTDKKNMTVPRPAMVSREEWGSKPDPIPASRKQTPHWITIHHAGEMWWNDRDPAQFVRNMQAWGKKRPQIEKPPRDTFWPDVPYHFLIAPDGKIFEGRPIQYEPDTNTRYKLTGNIGVELMGNFNVQRPSLEQVKSCVNLTAWLSQKYNIDLDHVRTHRDAAPGQTDCPGRDFYRYFLNGQFKSWVADAQAGKEAAIDLGPPLVGEGPGPTTVITDFHRPSTTQTTKPAQ